MVPRAFRLRDGGMNSMRPLLLDHRAGAGAAVRRTLNALLLLAVAGNIGAGWYYAGLRDQRLALEMRAETRAETRAANPRRVAQDGAAKSTPVTPATPAADAMNAELARARATVRALNLPWAEVFGAIEAAGSADVSLLALDPMPDKRMLKLHAEARNMDALLAYLRALGSNAVFSAVSLQSHQVQQADPLHPVRFVVLVEWRARS
jgi:hypothetical protein